ncbi:MAG: hypothetical protein GX495_02870 [Chloroflexi bacterium]|nr:hypothetical protein [Chloroflexota bacterium]
MSKVVIYGNGPVAKAAFHAITFDSPHEVAGFTVDRSFIQEDELFGLPVVPFEEVHSIFSPDRFLMWVAVGYVGVNRVRAERFQHARDCGYRMFTYVSQKATVGPDVQIGANCSIGVGCVISPSVRIGDNVTISAKSFIGPEAVIQDHCFLANRVTVAGGAVIEPYCFLGLNSTIKNGVRVASGCVIGAGALILQDTRAKEVYLGKPADLLSISSDDLPLR